MNKNQETKEKICTFFASDYHFEMISLPYISQTIQENKEVIILTENDLEDTIKVLLGNMNLKEENKNTILNLNWNQDDLIKFKTIKEKIEDNKDIVVFIKGKENYIHNINKNIEKWIKKGKNTKVIDCYDMEEIGDNLDGIMDQYKKILSTSGEKEIQKI